MVDGVEEFRRSKSSEWHRKNQEKPREEELEQVRLLLQVHIDLKQES